VIAYVFVIAFAHFVIVAKYAGAVHNKGKPIFEAMDTPRNG